MSPEVTAAVIAAGVSFLTLIGTLAAQYFGRRATSQDTQKTLEQQREQLDRTLAEQREQLNKTLMAQSEQLDKTLAEQRTRTLNERFSTAAEQLGSDKPAVRLAGVYAMAGLADDWEETRQPCVDVLCAYLRMPYEPDPGQDAPRQERLAFQAVREVRHTVIGVITAHLRDAAAVPWQGLNFDFRGVVFDGGDFRGAQFSGGIVNFSHAGFSGGIVDFHAVQFSGGTVDFSFAEFSGSSVDFRVVQFSGGTVDFSFAEFSGSSVDFGSAKFSGGTVKFGFTTFSGGGVDFRFSQFDGGEVDFGSADFCGGEVDFGRAQFSGGRVDFSFAEFSGGIVDFRDARDWSFPPAFPWTDTPPSGVKLPRKEGRSQA
jgi:uncharacterized protein YjbI with pentapeptide repeats/uncharacterized membrane-anchored protein YhcB (DUF1043 family)